MVTKCRSARQSARQSAKMDQRPEDQERGAGIGTDNISGRLLKAEWQQMARWRHWSMTSRDMDLAAVGMQMALGIVQQIRVVQETPEACKKGKVRNHSNHMVKKGCKLL